MKKPYYNQEDRQSVIIGSAYGAIIKFRLNCLIFGRAISNSKTAKIAIGIWLIGYVLLCVSCTNCQQEADDLYQQYLNSVQNANGNTAAIKEIKAQYEHEKSKLGC